MVTYRAYAFLEYDQVEVDGDYTLGGFPDSQISVGSVLRFHCPEDDEVIP